MIDRLQASARQLSGAALASALQESRARTLSLVSDLSDAQWKPPYQRGVNPIEWELGHLAWFAEFWILRGPHRRDAHGFAQADLAPQFFAPDTIYDSAQLAHAPRWEIASQERSALFERMSAQLQACIQSIPTQADDAALYFHRLALFHEDMHGEAFCWMRAALGFPAPTSITLPTLPNAPTASIEVSATECAVGFQAHEQGFAFDNELLGQIVPIKAFEIDSMPVRTADYLRFVEADGYLCADYWPGAAGQWRAQFGLAHPARWRKEGQQWMMRWFDQWLPLVAEMPIMHISAYEAEAYCMWAKRRLPTAAEWECAARQQANFFWGHRVWEWTADAFLPYAGFAPGPYREYSAPWFGDHRELRGGAFATHARMHDVRYRNFFQPHRHDIFAGFRTVAL